MKIQVHQIVFSKVYYHGWRWRVLVFVCVGIALAVDREDMRYIADNLKRIRACLMRNQENMFTVRALGVLTTPCLFYPQLINSANMVTARRAYL